jgi:WD40 repeat protein
MRLLFFILFTSWTILSFSQSNPYKFYKKLSTWESGYNTVETNKISFSTDEKYLAAGTLDGNFLIWEVDAGEIVEELCDGEKCITTYDTKFSPDGKYLVAVGKFHPHKGIKIWDAQNFQIIRTLTYDTIRQYDYMDNETSGRTVSSLCFTPDSKYMITADLDGMINVWETGTWKLKFTKNTKDYIWDIDISNHGDRVISGARNGITRIWTFDNGKLKLENSFRINDSEITYLTISENGNYYSTNSSDSLKLIDILTGRTKEVLMTIDKDSVWRESIISVCFDPTGKYFVSGHTYNDIKIWSTENLSQMWELKGDTNNPDQNETGYNWVEVSFSKSGNYIALSNDAGFIYLYKRQ